MAAKKKALAKPVKRPAAAKKPAPAAPEPKPVAFAPRKSTPVKPPPTPAAPAKPVAAAPAVDHSERVAALWARLEAWVAAAGAPPLALGKPATDKAIKAAGKQLGLSFPADVRASLRLHDGQTAKHTFPWLPGCPPLYALDAIVAEHARLARAAKPKTESCDATNRVRSGPRPGRIPLADGTYVDFEPGPAGTAGQLIALVSKTDFVLIDVSLTAALERWVTVLERGIWVYDAARHAVHPRLLAAAAGHPAGWFSKRA
jgi:cell wall assembly regulator SMI1